MAIIQDKKPQKAPLVFINDAIKASQIIIVDEEWKNVWTFDRYKALKMSEEAELDLIQLFYNPQTYTATCTIQDRGRYQYSKKKQDSEKKKKQAKWMKEIDFWYTISENDLKLKTDKAIELLAEWYSVRFVMKLVRRQLAFMDKARPRMEAVQTLMITYAKPQWIKQEAKWYSLILIPKK